MNKKEYEHALKELERLVTVVSEYESAHFSFQRPSPSEVLLFRMEQAGYTQTDLAVLLGSRQRASEYIHGKRKPSKRDAIKIHKAWGISMETLIQ